VTIDRVRREADLPRHADHCDPAMKKALIAQHSMYPSYPKETAVKRLARPAWCRTFPQGMASKTEAASSISKAIGSVLPSI
jgi:hypothetical protein